VARPGRPVYLSVCAIFRDEAPYLREWIEFHRLVGVERFFLYDHGSVDDARRVLAPYVAAGVAEVLDWPAAPPAQIRAYEHFLKRHRDDSRWVAFIDLDEFLFSPTGRPVSEVLEEFEDAPGVGVNWAAFGTSGHRTRPDGLVIESYVRRTSAYRINRHIKSIVDPAQVRCFCRPGFFMFFDGETVDERHRPVGGPPFSATDTVSFELLRLNHYTTRSEEEYRRKLSRPTPDVTTFEPARLEERRIAFLLRRHDEVRDETIQLYAEPLRAALGRPLGGPFSDEPKAGSQGEPDSGKNSSGDEQATAT
jgi:Glycosyltransferase family 92